MGVSELLTHIIGRGEIEKGVVLAFHFQVVTFCDLLTYLAY
jgi:hypothetical protein